MGQRLNLEFVQGQKVIGNAYYHWSAYTLSSLHLAKIALERLKELKEKGYSGRLMVSHALHATGAKMTPEELQWLKTNADTTKEDRLSYITQYTLYPSPVNRNDGLIGFSPESIQNTRNWAEGTVQIDIDTLTVNFGAMTEYRNAKDIRNDYELSDEEMNKIPHSAHEFNLCEMTSEELDQLSEICKVAYESKVYMFADADGTYYSMIE